MRAELEAGDDRCELFHDAWEVAAQRKVLQVSDLEQQGGGVVVPLRLDLKNLLDS